MDRRQLKKLAWHHAGLVVETALAEGWPFNDLPDDDSDEPRWLSKTEAPIMAEVLAEIVAEMLKRGRV